MFQNRSRVRTLGRITRTLAALALAAGLGLLARPVPAVELTPGMSAPLSGTTAAENPDLAGTVVADDLRPFEIRDGTAARFRLRLARSRDRRRAAPRRGRALRRADRALLERERGRRVAHQRAARVPVMGPPLFRSGARAAPDRELWPGRARCERAGTEHPQCRRPGPAEFEAMYY
jgi:hypothetical protein